MDNYDLLSPDQLRMASRRMRTELDNLYKARLNSACAICLEIHQLYAMCSKLVCVEMSLPGLGFLLGSNPIPIYPSSRSLFKCITRKCRNLYFATTQQL